MVLDLGLAHYGSKDSSFNTLTTVTAAPVAAKDVECCSLYDYVFWYMCIAMVNSYETFIRRK